MGTIERYPINRYGAHVQQAVSSAVITLDPDNLAQGVYLQAIGDDVRFTLDGTDPVAATTGFLLYDGHPPLLFDLGTGVEIKMIRNSGDCSVAIQYVGALS